MQILRYKNSCIRINVLMFAVKLLSGPIIALLKFIGRPFFKNIDVVETTALGFQHMFEASAFSAQC